MATEILIVEQEGVSLDLLLWRRFRRRLDGLAEAALGLNPGLADHGAILPVGSRVLVELPEPASAQIAEVVDLFS